MTGTTWTSGTTWTRGTTWTFGTTWNRRLLAAVLATLVLLAGSAGLVPARAAAAGELVEVVVTRATDAVGAAERTVTEAGGQILARLDIVDGFSALIPSAAVDSLRSAPGIANIAPNRRIELHSRRSTGQAVQGSASLDHIRRVVGADIADLLGFDGSGVGVALLDTGVATIEGLDANGKLLHGPDLTAESADPATANTDSFGHGTHMAGIIGANDNGWFFNPGVRGVATGSKVVSVKAAGRDGSTDLLTVLAGLEWIIQYKNTANIRVLNLSFGAPDAGDYRTDPLAAAVERVWNAGVVVVAAAGNDGEKPGSPITSPGTDPFVLTVGAVDTKGTDRIGDDEVEAFSPTGSSARRVDVVAPGHSVLSLRSPGSTADLDFPSARVGDRFFKGTGTSQATAVVAGVVADLLEQRPSLTPDQVKAVLRKSARNVPGGGVAQGEGMVHLPSALLTHVPWGSTQTHEPAQLGDAPPPEGPAAPPGLATPPCPPGAPEDVVCDDSPETTGGTWTGGTWTGGTWTGGTWTGGTWTGGTWTSVDGSVWDGGTWTGGTWTGGTWTGGTWTGGTWTGGTWTGGTWTGGTWTGGTWTGGTWTGGTWTGGTWTSADGSVWEGGTWTGGTWTGGTWTGGTWTGGTWTSADGSVWEGGTWTGGTWTGGTWTGGTWTGGTWTGGTWTGGTWTGGTWTGGTWTGGTWTGGTWTGGTWTGGTWTGGTWTGGTWTGAVWAGSRWS